MAYTPTSGIRALAIALIFVTSLYIPADTASAQSGGLKGSVCTGPAGDCFGPLPGATVTLTGLLGVNTYETRTDEGGVYAFGSVQDGDYTLKVTRTGFEPVEMQVQVQGNTAQDVQVPGTQVTVKGTVAGAGDSVNGNIWFEGPAGHRAEIKNGAFSVSLMSGWYEMGASAKGYQDGFWHMLLDGSNVNLKLEKAPDRTATLTGTVKDQDGRAVAGARVDAWQNTYRYYEGDVPHEDHDSPPSDGGTSSDELRTSIAYPGGNARATTDAQGKYTLQLFPGEASINIWKDGYASSHFQVQVKDGNNSHSATLEKFPEKTARIEGRVVDADGNTIPFVNINIQHPQYGLWTCSQAADGGNGNGGRAAPEPMPVDDSEPAGSDAQSDVAYPYYDPGCNIKVNSDGTFSGNVTPGYAIISVYQEHWRTCTETHHSDGAYTRTCGPEYQRWVRTMNLPAGQTTTFTATLAKRPGPDATVSGWVVDENGKAVQGAQIHFSQADGSGYGWASTDGDGSYKIRVRSGLQYVSVWAEGHFPWEGMVNVAPGTDTRYTVTLTVGESRYGGCCYAIAEDANGGRAVSDDADGVGMPSGAPRPPSDGAAGDDQEGGAATSDYEDLGGGLGPYDPSAATGAEPIDQPTPYAPLALLVAGLASLVAVMRRRT